MRIAETPYPANQQEDPLEELKKRLIEAEQAQGTNLKMEELDGLSEEELQRRLRDGMMRSTIYDNIPGQTDSIDRVRPMMMVYAGPKQMQNMAAGIFSMPPLQTQTEKPAGYCSECGVPLKRRSRFCPECGARLNWE